MHHPQDSKAQRILESLRLRGLSLIGMSERKREPRPEWLKVRIPGNESYFRLKNLVHEQKLNTVCEDARCPNIGECWGAGTATFMILGEVCTRACKFCAVKTGIAPGI